MEILRISGAYMERACALWNAYADGREIPHKEMHPDCFRQTFAEDDADVKKVSYIGMDGSDVVGFANGAYRESGGKGYITFVLVDKAHREKGLGTELLKALEQELLQLSRGKLKQFEVIFFNPVNLAWYVPGTRQDHPNAPGVDVSCGGYIFLKNRGYRDIAYQNSYYIDLKAYVYPADIQNRMDQLKAKRITICNYDPAKHSGFDELFDDLGNELWREAVLSNIGNPGGGDPVLIAEQNGKICGFTGPLVVQPGGRGSFAGIGVHSSYRSQGVGKVLFAALCMGLKENGAEFMTLFTGETNVARNIYEAASFKIVKTWADMRKEVL